MSFGKPVRSAHRRTRVPTHAAAPRGLPAEGLIARAKSGGVVGSAVESSLLMGSPGDAEKRIADLERELAQQRRINELERQLNQARAEPPPSPDDAGIDDLLSSLRTFGRSSAGRTPSAANPVDTRLSPAPRSVPVRFVLAEVLPFRWWYLTVLFIVAVPAAIVWATMPAAALPAAILTVVFIYAWQLVGTRTRLRLLRWGRVATVTGTEIASRASYYGGLTWYNAPLPVADGWRVTRPLWSGPSTTTTVRYTLSDYQGELSLRGREYRDGVILADQRHPDRARCVTFFPYDLDRDDSGNWIGRLRPRLVLGMVVWLTIPIGWLSAATAITTGYATRALRQAQTITIDAGTSARIDGNGLTRDVTCNQGHLTVGGNQNVVTVTGHCASVTVTGIKITVTVDDADTISINGVDSHVIYHSGDPAITNSGIGNSAAQG